MNERVWRPSWLNYWKSFALAAALVTLGFVVMSLTASAFDELTWPWWVFPAIGAFLALLVMGNAALDRFRWRYMVKSDGHVAVRRGIIARDTSEVRVQDIRLLGVEQGIVQRIFGLGDIEIATAGHSEIEIHMRGIRHPEAVKEEIRKLQAELKTTNE